MNVASSGLQQLLTCSLKCQEASRHKHLESLSAYDIECLHASAWPTAEG